MNILKWSSFLFKTIVVVIVTTGVAFGQPDAPPDNPPNPDDNPVPITGLEYLLLSGGILGGYKLFRNKGKKPTN